MNKDEKKHREIADEMLPIQPDFQIKQVKCYNIDCMAFMKTIPDNFYELAVVDPPYGIGYDGQSRTTEIKNSKKKAPLTYKEHEHKGWDTHIPEKSFFDELLRVSKNQIVCGGNYFANMLPNSRGWVYWDKKITNANNKNFSDGELIWTSYNKRLIKFTYDWIGFGYLNNPQHEKKIHPTHKPTQLYKWILTNYAKDGFKIFDSHGGSFSSACACLDMGFDIDICEIDKEYFDNAVNRLKNNVQEYLEF